MQKHHEPRAKAKPAFDSPESVVATDAFAEVLKLLAGSVAGPIEAAPNVEPAAVSIGAAQPVGRPGFQALVIDAGLISRADMATAEQHARCQHIELADGLVALGFLSESDSYRWLARAAGLDFVELEALHVSELSVRLVPERLARRHYVVPLSVDNRTLTYATCLPLDADTESDLAFASGRRTSARVAPRSAVLHMLEKIYPKVCELDLMMERLRAERPEAAQAHAPAAAAPSPSAIIDLCNHLVGRAVEVGASDVHIECTDESAVVRYRICGILETAATLPASASHPVRNRFKVMARADIAVRNKPQDGAFRLAVNGRSIDVRFSVLPTLQGEKLVLRVIDSHSPLQGLDRLGYDEEITTRLKQALARPDGLMLVTGPTGSGKTTALYAALAHLQTGQTNIVSVEDPVERTLPGVTQVPVNTKAGTTFATILRSLLRQDPNVIMVGEVRDAEVAQIVGQAAYTGHLVLTSMHTTDAATAITRLMNLGLEPFKVAESLCGVLAQRLLRKLCPKCRRMHSLTEARRLGVEHGVPSVPASAGPGCEQCQQTGYHGRVPVAELLTPSEEMRSTIARGATAHEIRAAMQAAGTPTMHQIGMRLVAEGVTSVEEVNRVLSSEQTTAKQVRTQPRVLIADDESMTRMLVKLLLEKAQFEVIEAKNGREAVDMAVRERPDLLMTDLQMPDMDGYEAVGRIRQNLGLATMPILVVTAEDGPGVEQRVLELGADDYIVKPFDAAVLLSRVNAVFRRLKVPAA